MQLSEHSVIAGQISLDEKNDDSSRLKEDLDEQAKAGLSEADDQNDDQVESEQVLSTPSIWSRFRKVILILVAIWLSLAILRGTGNHQPKVIHAKRYSENYKFRPAASPIVTETLKDGRLRVRGAEPTARSVPPARPKPETRKRKSGKRRKARSGK